MRELGQSLSRHARPILFALAGVFSLVNLWHPWSPVLERAMYDSLWRLQAQVMPDTRLAVIDIDETSIDRLGPWPWPRARIADLVELLLVQQGVRAVALDMVLPYPADPEGDARLAAMSAHGPVVLAVAFDFVERHPRLLQGVLPPAGARQPRGRAVPATGFVANHAGLAQSRCIGNIGFIPDTDGRLRQLPARVGYGGMSYPSLAEALIACNGQGQGPSPHVNEEGFWRLSWRKKLESYPVIPASVILEGGLPDGSLKGRWVIVGSSAFGLADRVATPLDASASGVMVHAAAIAELLDTMSGAVAQPWPGDTLALLYTLSTLSLLLWMFSRAPPWVCAWVIVAGAMVWPFIAAVILVHDPETRLTTPLVGMAFVLLFAIPWEWWQSRREVRRTLEILRHYVAPEVIDELRQTQQGYSLTPKYSQITVLNADMQGYTRHTASVPLAQAASLTRDFLELLTQAVLRHGGTLDKYTGDGLVAFWGAPLRRADHAMRALEAALEIESALSRWNETRLRAHLPIVKVAMGIESGPALVGDLGSTFRSTYTAVGDCINLAAKLQQACRSAGEQLLIGPHARDQLVAMGVELLPVETALDIAGLQGTCYRFGAFAKGSAPLQPQQEGSCSVFR
jgi:adenylate cyclase